MTRISTYSSFAMGIAIEDRIAAVKKAGFDSICLDFEKELEDTETSWENQVRLAKKYSLPIENVHLTSAGMTDMWKDGCEGELLTERLICELRDMARLGITVGVAHVTWGHTPPMGNMELGLKRYERIAGAAEKYGVQVALENSVYPEYLCFLLDSISSRSIGFCYDSGHENAFSRGADLLDRYADRLYAMHLHDNDGVNDLHALPSSGSVDWKKTVSSLRRSRLFSQVLTLECTMDSADMDKWLERAYRSAQKLLIL